MLLLLRKMGLGSGPSKFQTVLTRYGTLKVPWQLRSRTGYEAWRLLFHHIFAKLFQCWKPIHEENSFSKNKSGNRYAKVAPWSFIRTIHHSLVFKLSYVGISICILPCEKELVWIAWSYSQPLVTGKSLWMLGLEFSDHTCSKRKLTVYLDIVSRN